MQQGISMNLSNQLIDKLKTKIGTEKEREAAELIPHLTKQNLSEIRKGKRHLTEEQALWIAEECALDCALVLVELAEECSKSEKAKMAWHSLAKKLKAASSILLLADLVSISGTSGLNQSRRLKNSP
jgi:hypothetical protein